jgi:hypothetical protein
MNNKKIKEKIISSIGKAEDKGFTLITDDWGSVSAKCACAIGCVLVVEGKPINSTITVAAQILGVSDEWITSFTDGFDGNGKAEGAYDPEAWTLGETVRKETNPIPFDRFADQMDEDQGE